VRFQVRVQVFGIQLVDLAARTESLRLKKRARRRFSSRASPVHFSRKAGGGGGGATLRKIHPAMNLERRSRSARCYLARRRSRIRFGETSSASCERSTMIHPEDTSGLPVYPMSVSFSVELARYLPGISSCSPSPRSRFQQLSAFAKG